MDLDDYNALVISSGLLQKAYEGLKENQEALESQRAKLDKGRLDSIAHLWRLKKANITLLSEYDTVLKLKKSFEAKLAEVNAEMALNWTSLAITQAQLLTARKAIESYQPPIENTAKILEFPSDRRRSQEED